MNKQDETKPVHLTPTKGGKFVDTCDWCNGRVVLERARWPNEPIQCEACFYAGDDDVTFY